MDFDQDLYIATNMVCNCAPVGGCSIPTSSPVAEGASFTTLTAGMIDIHNF